MPSASRLLTWLTPSPSTARKLKFLALALFGFCAVLVGLLVIHKGILPIVAWIFPSLRQTFWDLAVYGVYPTERYVSFGLPGPEASIVRWDETCDDGLVFASVYGPGTPYEGPSILDARGNLVWTSKGFGTVLNFRVQKFRGKNHLTFWAGRKQGSLGLGAYEILNDSYDVVKRVHAVGEDLRGDLHEFEITEDDTALITIYTPRQVDMRPMGLWRPENGWIMDSMFQEIDIETGELLFEWKASDHFRPEETYYTNPLAGRQWKSAPFDFFHINSIQKDPSGNYLISSRHLHTISYINGTDGKPIWTLGGNYTDFTDLSDGHASDFRWQHHAHWFSQEEGIISLFDNQAAGPLHEDAPYSKGVLIQLDVSDMTATLLQTYVSINQMRSASQGSMQLLDPTDHVFIGWGSSAAFTEFNMAGEALCEVHLAAESSFWWERVKSYRTYKEFDWVAKGGERPIDAVVKGQKAYVSWNGATEVRYWELQGSLEGAIIGSGESGESEVPEWEAIEMIEKVGFEGVFELPTDRDYLRYRVAALDGEKMYLAYSDTAFTESTGWAGTLGAIFGITVAVTCMVCLWFFLKVWVRRRSDHQHSLGTANHWELSSIAKVFGRRGNGYAYSKLPE